MSALCRSLTLVKKRALWLSPCELLTALPQLRSRVRDSSPAQSFLILAKDLVKRQAKGLRLRCQPFLLAFCFRIARPAIRYVIT